jgi:hypothetical protein
MLYFHFVYFSEDIRSSRSMEEEEDLLNITSVEEGVSKPFQKIFDSDRIFHKSKYEV